MLITLWQLSTAAIFAFSTSSINITSITSDVLEIVEVSASVFFEGEMVMLDNQAVLDALLLKADRFSDTLRKVGWSSEEVSDALSFYFRPEERKPAVKLSPELAQSIGKLADSVNRSSSSSASSS